MKYDKIKAILFCLAVFFIPLLIYILTLAPTVTFGDSGELIAAAYSSGIPHPPGFPLWVFLTHFFTLLPFKNIAWRVNLGSAAFTSFAALVLAKIIIEILAIKYPQTKKYSRCIIAGSLSLVFAFSQSAWASSVIAEVHSLQTLLGLLIIFVFFRWCQTEKRNLLYLLSFLAGLSLTNHLLSLTFIPPIILGVLIKEKRIIKKPRALVFSLILFFVGLSFYLYLPLRSVQNPLIDWGGPKNLTRFINHITRKQYGLDQPKVVGIVYLSIKQNVSFLQRIFHGFYLFIKNSWGTFGPLLFISLLGVYIGLKKKLKPLIFLLIMTFFCGPFFYMLAADPKAFIPENEKIFMEVLSALATFPIFMAIGFAEIMEKLKKISKPILLAIAILPLIFLFLNYQDCDYSHNNIAYLHAQNIINTLPQNATLIGDDDESAFPVFYLLKVEKVRPDINFLDRNGNLYPFSYPLEIWEEKSWKNLDEFLGYLGELDVEYSREVKGNAFLTDIISCNEKKHRGILTLPEGQKDQEVDFMKLYGNILNLNNSDLVKDPYARRVTAYYHLAYGFSAFKKDDLETAKKHFQLAEDFQLNDSWTIDQIGRCWSAIGEKGRAASAMEKKVSIAPEKASSYLNLGVMYAKKGDFEKAEEKYQEAMELDPKVIPVAAKNLGYLYMEKGEVDKAQEMFIKVIKENPEIKDDKFFYAFGTSYFLQNQYEQAETYLKKAVGINDRFPASQINLALVLIKQEKIDEAKEHLERALELDPENEEIKDLLQNSL